MKCVTESLYFCLDNDHPKLGSDNDDQADLLIIDSPVEVQTNSLQGELILLVRNNPRTIKPVTIEAGYGRLWEGSSTLHEICSDYQEPSFAYLSAHFRF